MLHFWGCLNNVRTHTYAKMHFFPVCCCSCYMKIAYMYWNKHDSYLNCTYTQSNVFQHTKNVIPRDKHWNRSSAAQNTSQFFYIQVSYSLTWLPCDIAGGTDWGVSRVFLFLLYSVVQDTLWKRKYNFLENYSLVSHTEVS